MIRYVCLSIIICILGITGVYTTVFAQYDFGSSDSISLTLLPANPHPKDTVYATAESYGTNLDVASFTWTLDGKQIASGKGIKDVSFVAGVLGSTQTLSVTIITGEGERITKEAVIHPSTVDILWEAQTYTPPFYEGKSLFTNESDLIVYAVPHIVRNNIVIPASQLVYKWSKNGVVLGDQNGYGKQSLLFPGSLITRTFDISVEVTDPVTNFSAYNVIQIQPHDPVVKLYRKDPLVGVQFAQAIQNAFTLTSDEIEITAVPFFFSPMRNITYTWTANGDSAGGGNVFSKIFRRKGNGSGTARIHVSVESPDKILQLGDASFDITFTKKETE